jgi:hypothetical protein
MVSTGKVGIYPAHIVTFSSRLFRPKWFFCLLTWMIILSIGAIVAVAAVIISQSAGSKDLFF